jgi:hypothetical protein
MQSALAAVSGLNDQLVDHINFKCSISHNLEKQLYAGNNRQAPEYPMMPTPIMASYRPSFTTLSTMSGFMNNDQTLGSSFGLSHQRHLQNQNRHVPLDSSVDLHNQYTSFPHAQSVPSSLEDSSWYHHRQQLPAAIPRVPKSSSRVSLPALSMTEATMENWELSSAASAARFINGTSFKNADGCLDDFFASPSLSMTSSKTASSTVTNEDSVDSENEFGLGPASSSPLFFNIENQHGQQQVFPKASKNSLQCDYFHNGVESNAFMTAGQRARLMSNRHDNYNTAASLNHGYNDHCFSEYTLPFQQQQSFYQHF